MKQAELPTQPSLESVVSGMLHRLEIDPSWRDSHVLALLARMLIAAEVAPGGPYKDEHGRVSKTLNQKIAMVCGYLGLSLPGLDKYLAATTPGDSAGVTIAPLLPIQLNPSQRHAEAVVAAYGSHVRPEAEHQLHRILRADRMGEISRLAELFSDSMTLPARIDCTELGSANLLTWMAYSIYDDVLDEQESAAALPIANQAHRDALRLYIGNMPEEFASFCYSVFSAMDEANAWELASARFVVNKGRITIAKLPRYGTQGILARRAGAHVLGPLIVMLRARLADRQIAQAQNALFDYLIARQLNDDLHDWVEDVERGHISPVVAHLIKQAGITRGEYALDEVVTRMKQLFWESGLVTISSSALRSITRSQARLINAGIINRDTPFLLEIIRPLQDSLQQGLERHEQDKSFFEAYRSQSPASD